MDYLIPNFRTSLSNPFSNNNQEDYDSKPSAPNRDRKNVVGLLDIDNNI